MGVGYILDQNNIDLLNYNPCPACSFPGFPYQIITVLKNVSTSTNDININIC